MRTLSTDYNSETNIAQPGQIPRNNLERVIRLKKDIKKESLKRSVAWSQKVDTYFNCHSGYKDKNSQGI